MESNTRLDAIFFALADSRRRAILEELSEDKKQVSDLAKNFSLSLGAISKHIAVLENADLLYKTRQGRRVFCHLNFDIWKEVISYIGMHSKFWNSRLDELENFIENKI